MTDIGVFTQNAQAENLSWDLGTPHQGYSKMGTIAVAAFTQSQHFPNGYIPSGTILALASASTYSGFLVPYLDAGSNGFAVAVGILKASITVVQLNGALKAKVGCAYWVAFRPVSASKLPNNSTNQAAGGYLDADAKTDLPLIYFDA